MKKIILAISIMAIAFGLTIASAQPQGPPPPGMGPLPHGGPPPPGMGFPPGGPPGPQGQNRREKMEAWQRFQREHPDEARAIMQLLEQYPELRGVVGPPGARHKGQGRRGRGENVSPEHREHMRQLREKREAAMKMSEKYRTTDDAKEKRKIEKEMRTLLGEIYELRREVMRYKVKKVEKKLAKVKEELSKYEKDRSGVIDSWINQLTDADGYKKF